MKTYTIDLPELLDQFVAEQVAAGEHRDVESAIIASLLKDKAEADAEKVKEERFWAKIASAEASFERGEGIEVTDLDVFFDEILAEVEAELTDKAA